eukprot:TRINITY_DN2480_c0_g1_i9.p3 TRINITY_DN2480_c0_g1~~TRINITY_DN2480_c0_g1_i9.p3  ORF type:complete len:140 (+),score=29.36 TRINITY_DN2480_c0_g1_i9:1-420(+)
MTGPQAIKVKRKIVKRTKHFERPYSDRFMRLGTSWRRPRGIDNPIRRRYRGMKKMAKIGFGTDKRARYQLPNGFKKFLVKNLEDMDVLLMNNRKYCAEIAANLSARKKAVIIKKAQEMNVKVINAKGKLKAEEKKQEKA